MRDLSYALRQLRRSPLFTIAATLTLALAIGATASVFGLVDGVLLKAFPYRDADRVMTVWESNPPMQMRQAPASAPDYLEFRAQTHAFSDLAAGNYREFTVTGNGEPQHVLGAEVTPNYFPALGITPVLGRGLTADSAGPAEVVIGYGLWQRRFGGSPGILGRTLRLNDHPYVVVGVAPAGLSQYEEILTRLTFTPALAADRDDKTLVLYGRLAPGVTESRAEQDLDVVAQRLGAAYPVTNGGWSARVVPLLDSLVGSVRPALLMLLAAAACVLLIGAANLANLFLVRCLARDREMAVRTALGATRRRLIGEFLLEAGVLCVVAGAIGVALAAIGVRTLRTWAPESLPRLSQITLDGRLVAFCVIVSLLSMLVVGFVPAWQGSRARLAEVLKQGGRSGSPMHRRTQSALVVLQVAIALMLLTGAGLLVESFDHFRRMEPGFRPDGVLTARVLLGGNRYATPERQSAFASALVDALTGQPGFQSASVSSYVPGPSNDVEGFGLVGDAPPDAGHIPLGYLVTVTPAYFQTMGIPLQRGREFRGSDDLRGSRVAIVDASLVRRYFGSRDPVGQRLTFINTPDSVTIVGVVGSVKQGGLALDDRPQIYLPFAQSPRASAVVVVRVANEPAMQAGVVARTVAALDPTIPVYDVRTMQERLGQSVGTTRFSTVLASLFAVVSLVLGAVGIYSVLSHVVSQERREIGVRVALGASPADVMGDVLRRALVVTGLGVLVGTGAAWVLTRLLAGVFVGVSPHDPVVFIGAAVVFAAVAALAASIPAYRTTRVSPVVALTY